jgi:1,4-dihydroxy-2-naphthoyl-CoA hydrolase
VTHDFVELGRRHLPGLLGIDVHSVEYGSARMSLPLRAELLAPNGYLHAGTVVGLADSACGYGCVASFPEGAMGFTTIELTANFLATAREGTLACEAKLVHGGRTTQVWDATVTREDGKRLAVFRCTQLILYAGNEKKGQSPSRTVP